MIAVSEIFFFDTMPQQIVGSEEFDPRPPTSKEVVLRLSFAIRCFAANGVGGS